MKTWNERLTEARETAGLKKAELARRVGVSSPTVTDWESGKIKKLDADNMMKVCQTLSISGRWLMQGKGLMKSIDMWSVDGPVGSGTPHISDKQSQYSHANVEPGPDIKGWVPLISWVQAGDWAEAIDNGHPGDGGEGMYACPVPHSSRTFALRVEGDSMTAPYGRTYPKDAYIYCDPEQRGGVASGDRVIAKLNGDNQVTFKVFVEEAGRRYLKPLNPQHPTLFDEFRILAKVIGMFVPE